MIEKNLEEILRNVDKTAELNYRFDKQTTNEIIELGSDIRRLHDQFWTGLEIKLERVPCFGVRVEGDLELWGKTIIKSFMLAACLIYEPICDGILIDYLVGNLHACAFQLRLMLETLGRVYHADKNREDSWRYIEDWEVRRLLWNLPGASTFLAGEMWVDLSEMCHYAGAKEITPFFVLPYSYQEENKDKVRKFGELVSRFRQLFRIVWEEWQKTFKVTAETEL
jgi:hypothetical protein